MSIITLNSLVPKATAASSGGVVYNPTDWDVSANGYTLPLNNTYLLYGSTGSINIESPTKEGDYIEVYCGEGNSGRYHAIAFYDGSSDAIWANEYMKFVYKNYMWNMVERRKIPMSAYFSKKYYSATAIAADTIIPVTFSDGSASLIQATDGAKLIRNGTYRVSAQIETSTAATLTFLWAGTNYRTATGTGILSIDVLIDAAAGQTIQMKVSAGATLLNWANLSVVELV